MSHDLKSKPSVQEIIHEINNPMTWILANITYINNTLQKLAPVTPEQEKIFSKVRDAANDALEGCHKIQELTQKIEKDREK